MMGNIIILNMVYWTSSIKGVFEYSLFNEIKQGIINTSVFYKKSINKYKCIYRFYEQYFYT